MWLVFVIISMFISGFLEIIEKKGSNKQPLQFWAIAILLYGLLNVILGIILSPNIINNFDINIFWLTFPISFLSTIGYYFSIKALNNAPISKVAPILRSKIILVLILSSIFINDKLSILQVILIFLLLILIILLNKDKKVTTKSKKGMIYAFGYLISNGSATFINKIVIDMVPDPISITFYTGLTSILSIVIVLLLINKLELLDIKNFKSKKQVICMESLEAITMLLLRYAMIEGNVVIITAMTSSSIIIAIILSKIIFKEKINSRKWIIIILITIALVCLSIISI